MNKLKSSLLVVAAVLACVLPASAQPAARVASTGGNSAHETTSAVIDGSRVTITYGRPLAKTRKIWGTLVPFGKAWRMGSDEATLLLTQQPLDIGGKAVPAGAYTLYLVPNEAGASQLAISKNLGGWGVPVDEKNDLARVDLKKDATPAAVEQFTMSVQKNPAGTGGLIKLSWENTEYSVAFTVKK